MFYFDWIDHHAGQRPEKTALYCCATRSRLDFGRLSERIHALAWHLTQDLGVRPGDRVCLLSKSRPEAFELQFACAKAGAIFVPLNWRLAAAEQAHVWSDAEPRVLFGDAAFSQAASEFAPDTPYRRLPDGGAGRESPYEAGIASHRGRRFPNAEVDPEDIWCMLYTSGTTGKPKGVMLSYRMVQANVVNFSFPTRITRDTVFLCAMPTFHTGGLNVYANPVLHAGGTVLLMPDFDAGAALAAMNDPAHGVTHFFGTPTHYILMQQDPGFASATFPAMVNAGIGGAPPTADLVAAWLRKGVPLQPTYGMTEIGPGILTTDLDRVQDKLGTSGRPGLHMAFKIAAADGAPLGPGEVGEIWVKGPPVMSGYWRNPEATAACLADGWFRSGDAAYRDEEGFVYIVDRIKDMYISGGENVYPAEVEQVIAQLDAVSLCAVVGAPDPKWGEVGVAYVVLRDGCALAEEAALAHCRARLARYKVPRRVLFLPGLPLTASGKIRKQALRQRAAGDCCAAPQKDSA